MYKLGGKGDHHSILVAGWSGRHTVVFLDHFFFVCLQLKLITITRTSDMKVEVEFSLYCSIVSVHLLTNTKQLLQNFLSTNVALVILYIIA